jgi:hypothetical protein
MITRRHIVAATGGLAALATAGAVAAQGSNVSTQARNGMMQIIRNGSRPSAKGPAEYFTGAVRIDPLFQAGDPSRVSGGHVTFEPGARSAWHTASAWADADRHVGPRLGPGRGRAGRGNPARRCGLVSREVEALARSHADNGYDAHRHHGISARQERRLAGKGQRGAIPALMMKSGLIPLPRRELRWLSCSASRGAFWLAARNHNAVGKHVLVNSQRTSPRACITRR